jgi:hypothetical protein
VTPGVMVTLWAAIAILCYAVLWRVSQRGRAVAALQGSAMPWPYTVAVVVLAFIATSCLIQTFKYASELSWQSINP